MSPEALQAEYAKLPVEELKMHFLAAKSALMAAMSGGGDASADPSADPAAAGGPPGPDASAGPAPAAGPEGSAAAPEASAGPVDPMMGKKEFNSSGNGGQISKSQLDPTLQVILTRLDKAEKAASEVTELRKSLATKDAQLAEMEANLGKVAEGFSKIIERPMRKAITSISHIAKPGSEQAAPGTVDISRLSKAEINDRLNKATRSESLSKADRDAITKYVVGKAPVETVVKFLA
jgi:hypothetical protein